MSMSLPPDLLDALRQRTLDDLCQFAATDRGGWILRELKQAPAIREWLKQTPAQVCDEIRGAFPLVDFIVRDLDAKIAFLHRTMKEFK